MWRQCLHHTTRKSKSSTTWGNAGISDSHPIWGPESTKGTEDNRSRFGCYLDGKLELFVLPLQLLCLRQRAGVDQAGIEHWLSIADPSQNLGSWGKHTGERPPVVSPELLPSLQVLQSRGYLELSAGERTARILASYQPAFPVSGVIGIYFM